MSAVGNESRLIVKLTFNQEILHRDRVAELQPLAAMNSMMRKNLMVMRNKGLYITDRWVFHY
jgi:hypothetical protein